MPTRIGSLFANEDLLEILDILDNWGQLGTTGKEDMFNLPQIQVAVSYRRSAKDRGLFLFAANRRVLNGW